MVAEQDQQPEGILKGIKNSKPCGILWYKRPLFEQPQPLGDLSLLSAAPRGVLLLAATVFGHFSYCYSLVLAYL